MSRTVGEYTLIRELGRGAMGEVWLAQHGRLERTVALKMSVRWTRHAGSGRELGFLWGPKARQVAEGYIPIDPRALVDRGRINVLTLHRSSQLVPESMVLDHVVIYGIPQGAR